MRGLVLALCISGCGFSTGGAASTDASTTDGKVPIDAPEIDAKPDPLCVGTFVNVCVDPPPTEMVTLTTQKIDTSTSPLCGVYTSTPELAACVIAAKSISIPGGNKLNVIGAKPLILLAETITITGEIDAASHRSGGQIGPAADAGCMADFTSPSTGGGRSDGGGGWGGSFGGKGGNGGGGGEDGAAGIAPSTITPSTLRGGCAGGKGAGGDGGNGGHGGGAVALIAKQTLTVDGVVNASGAAGGGAKNSSGGGGGGSGGMIVLDAATVNVIGRCFANGGGAGEGANADADGNSGSESTAPNAVGDGGSGGTSVGGNGGDGAVGATLTGKTGNTGGDLGGGAVGGGGGGGGGSGVIKVYATTKTGTDDITKVAPPPI